MLGFYLKMEAKLKGEIEAVKIDAEFENALFIHRPEWYQELENIKAGEGAVDENNIEWQTPQNVDEFAEMMEAFREDGLIT